MTQKHTPLPWHRNVNHKYPIYAETTPGKKDWKYIANIIPGERASTTDEEKDANLEFIVHACNSHYELLEALKAAKAFFVHQGIDVYPVSDVMDRAIAKATGS